MCVRYCIEAVDSIFRAMMQSPRVPFGGKCILFSDDFRQILPVVPRGSRRTIVHLSLKSSPLFPEMHRSTLTENMRVRAMKNDPRADAHAIGYPDYLLKVGEGKVPTAKGSCIEFPKYVNVVHSPQELVTTVLNGLESRFNDVQWLASCAILDPTNSRLHDLNSQIAERFPGKFRTYKRQIKCNAIHLIFEMQLNSGTLKSC